MLNENISISYDLVRRVYLVMRRFFSAIILIGWIQTLNRAIVKIHNPTKYSESTFKKVIACEIWVLELMCMSRFLQKKFSNSFNRITSSKIDESKNFLDQGNPYALQRPNIGGISKFQPSSANIRFGDILLCWVDSVFTICSLTQKLYESSVYNWPTYTCGALSADQSEVRKNYASKVHEV